MGTVWQDLRFGLRVLAKQPAFTVVAVVTLALGIGANTAIFSVVNAVLLSPLPFPESGRLVDLNETFKPSGFGSVSVPNLRDWQQQNTVFEGIAGYGSGNFNLEGGDIPQRLQALRVEANYFDVLGLRPQLGRTFAKGEDEAGRDRVVVLSDALWRASFGADPDIVDKTVPLNGQNYTVVGVMPPSLSALSRTQLWAPLVFSESEKAARGSHSFQAIGRLKDGVTMEQAAEQMSAIAARLEQQYPDAQAGRGVRLAKYEERITGGLVRTILLVLLGAVGFVLLIACTNVANLLLARAAGRYREIAVRMALGAGAIRLVRQFLTEGLLLSVAGGALGVAVAWLGLDLLGKLAFAFVPRSSEIRLDGRVLLFTLGVSVLTGVVFGVAPAMQAVRTNVQEALKDGSNSSTLGMGGGWVRSALVVTEVAAAFVLLIGAGLLINSFARLVSVSHGVDPENVLTARLSLPQEKYPDADSRRRFHEQVLARVSAIPGVEAAGLTSHLSIEQYGTNGNVPVEGRTYPPNQEPIIEMRTVSPDYFRAMGVRLLRGRTFDHSDTPDAPPGIVINDAMARALWPGEDPIGKRVFGRPAWVPVIGVVSDVRNRGLTRPSAPELYWDYRQGGGSMLGNVTLAVRSRLDPATLTAAARREVRAVDPGQPVFNVQTMQAVIDSTVSDRRLMMTLIGVLAAISLALAVVGIYGVMSYTVAQHTREIGIRVALGAQRADIYRLIVGKGLVLTAVGLALGLAASFGLTRFLESLLFEVKATDPLTFAGVALLLTSVALLACLFPARRATKVDPMVALRYE
ncbi:MAG TPA: ABC transporter permease [Pyrinomonadaceae bacterium]